MSETAPATGAFENQAGIMSTKERFHAVEVSPGDEGDNKVRYNPREVYSDFHSSKSNILIDFSLLPYNFSYFISKIYQLHDSSLIFNKNLEKDPMQLADRLCAIISTKANDEPYAPSEQLKEMHSTRHIGSGATPAGFGSSSVAVMEVSPDGPRPGQTSASPAEAAQSGISAIVSPGDDAASMAAMAFSDANSDSKTLMVGVGQNIIGSDSQMLEALPTVPSARLKRDFHIEGINGVEITSLDVTAHGCYLLAGCGNGMVLLFDLTQNLSEPALVGHIQAKGLHTNLLMNVRITEDCRFCFAGVAKGSSELLVIDLGRLPVWGKGKAGFRPVRRPVGFVNDRVTCTSRSDPKLRGFGAAVRVRGNYARDTYRLASGIGIKNVHVWQFTPGPTPETSLWVCMYDVASNGNTIESIGFRNGGQELLSKSVGVNLRLWDLSSFDTVPDGKPTFEDISNSADVRSLLDGFAFGGVYEFAMVRLAAPKVANRDVLEVPERRQAAPNDAGDRRRRLMRQIDHVIGTDDARHAMILCADGGVLYYNRPEDSGGRGELLELPQLERDPDTLIQSGARDWSLQRVGASGEVVLLRATQSVPVQILISPLGMIAPDACSSSQRAASMPADANGRWTEWGYYCAADLADQEEIEEEVEQRKEKDKASRDRESQVDDESDSVVAKKNTVKPSVQGRPPLPPAAATGIKRPRSRPDRPMPSAASTASMMSPSPVPREAAAASAAAPHRAVVQDRGRRPAAASLSHGQPTPPKVSGGAIPVAHLPLALNSALAAQTTGVNYMHNLGSRRLLAPGDGDAVPFVFEDVPTPKRAALPLAPAKRVRRVIEAPFNSSAYLTEAREHQQQLLLQQSGHCSAPTIVMERFKFLCSHFLEAGRRAPQIAPMCTFGAGRVDGICTLRKIGEHAAEQARVRSQFMAEVTRTVSRHLMVFHNSSEQRLGYNNAALGVEQGYSADQAPLPLPDAALEVDSVIGKYQSVMHDLMCRQQLEVAGALAADALTSINVQNFPALRREDAATVAQRHADLWGAALSFVENARMLMRDSRLGATQ
jgi:hypothetical protein